MFFSVISVFLSAAALYVSYSAYTLKREDIAIFLKRNTSACSGIFAVFPSLNLNGISGFASSRWEIIVSNKSDMAVSLTEWSANITLNGREIYSGDFLPRLYSEICSKSEVEIPINIEPGYSKKFYVEVGIPVDRSSAEGIEKAIASHSSLPANFKDINIKNLGNHRYEFSSIYDIIKLSIISSSIDIFGNPVKMDNFFENGYRLSWGESPYRQPIITFSVKTSRGNHVDGHSTWFSF